MLVSFPIAGESDWREEALIFVHSSRVQPETPWRQGPQAAGHIAFTDRRQRDMDAHA